MRERSAFTRPLALMLTLAVAAPAIHARPADPSEAPTRYLGHGVDVGLVTVASPRDGRLWSAWAYRTGGEFDVAVSVRDQNGLWSEPVLIGAGDNKSQIDPALAFDSAGNLYVAHSVRETGQVFVSRLAAGATRMTSPMLVSVGGERASSPSLLPSSTTLVIGYRVGTRVVLRMISVASATHPFGVQDGPDGFPPSRSESDTSPVDGPTGIGPN